MTKVTNEREARLVRSKAGRDELMPKVLERESKNSVASVGFERMVVEGLDVFNKIMSIKA